MKTILVPTDFSRLSANAVRYAVGLAKNVDATILMVSVVNVNATSQTLMKWHKLEEEMLEIAQQDADVLMAEIKAETVECPSLTYRSIKGFPLELVIEHAATGLKKVLLGSNAAGVIDHSSVPVLAVPEDAVFRDVKRIVYATDMVNLQAEVQSIASYAKILGAEICILHVVPANNDLEIDTQQRVQDLIAIAGYPAITFHLLRNDRIAEAVETFVEEQQGDLLAMFTHKLGFYEKLFGKSVTQRLALHAKTPLLTFNKTMLKEKVAGT
jgi:nucleotide-binding universal stress UspA family protein